MTRADTFHAHVEQCAVCREVQQALCPAGRELLLAAAGRTTVTMVKEQLERHEAGDVEATLWLREHAPAIAALFIGV